MNHTSRDIARLVGMNIIIVSRMLAGAAKIARIGDETACRVLSVAEELG